MIIYLSNLKDLSQYKGCISNMVYTRINGVTLIRGVICEAIKTS